MVHALNSTNNVEKWIKREIETTIINQIDSLSQFSGEHIYIVAVICVFEFYVTNDVVENASGWFVLSPLCVLMVSLYFTSF